jgi:hypothetical protein
MDSLTRGRATADRRISAKLRASAVATATWPDGYWNIADPGAWRATRSFSNFSTASVVAGAITARTTAFQRRRVSHDNRAVAAIPPTVRARSPMASSTASRNCRSLWAPSRYNAHVSRPDSRVECQTSPPRAAVTRMANAAATAAHGGARETPGGVGVARRPPAPSRPTMGSTGLHAALSAYGPEGQPIRTRRSGPCQAITSCPDGGEEQLVRHRSRLSGWT